MISVWPATVTTGPDRPCNGSPPSCLSQVVEQLRGDVRIGPGPAGGEVHTPGFERQVEQLATDAPASDGTTRTDGEEARQRNRRENRSADRTEPGVHMELATNGWY